MISKIDEQLRPFGVCSPIRYLLHMRVVKLKLISHAAGMGGKRIQLRIQALDDEQKVDVLEENKINKAPGRERPPDAAEFYSIEKDL